MEEPQPSVNQLNNPPPSPSSRLPRSSEVSGGSGSWLGRELWVEELD
ncbi:MAG: hypothetical protein HYT73_02545 [Candidatus Aenigmarchaeota archaeon]|nr:hypothetical protein [Candidatus Aenigmarchaeota archaeon]